MSSKAGIFMLMYILNINNMKKNATLLVLAAGMGSRYGGLKQLDAFGPNGETIIDYSLYDAINAGFSKVVFIIRESFREDFESIFRPKLEGKIEVAFVAQDLADLPEGYDLPEAREKPWGTGHAVLVAKDVIDGPFGIINADDYYGQTSYKTLIDFFADENNPDYCIVGYLLKNTLSDHGDVNRGVCMQNKDGYLEKIVETLKISKKDESGTGEYKNEAGEMVSLDPETLVSMNMFGFKEDFFEKGGELFKAFLDEHLLVPKSEFFIPLALDIMINSGERKVKVLTSDSDWFGVTYQEDKPHVVAKINKLIEAGRYPQSLWA